MLQYLLLQNKTMFMHVHVFYVNKLDEEYKAKGFFLNHKWRHMHDFYDFFSWYFNDAILMHFEKCT